MQLCHLCKKNIGSSRGTIVKLKKKDGSTVTHIYMRCRACNTELHRKYRATERGAERVREAVRKSTKKHKHKQNAREVLHRCLKAGEIIKPDSCENCSNSKVEAHHSDYSKPLEVNWLCRQCHADLHKV